ncbi:hypothetical protein MKX47_11830 [Solibacillus sp. FSL R7-0668]|uniref:hypothetical protein n=1 Tax=Solibacillus sp. FSL R7-0668 TaxID=2921688 RepID=UPI0030FCC0F5
MVKSTKDIKVTLDYDVMLNSVTYACLYLEQRIEHCKAVGRNYSQYEHDLDEINKAIKKI